MSETRDAQVDELITAVLAVAEVARRLPAFARAGQEACRETYRLAMEAERLALDLAAADVAPTTG